MQLWSIAALLVAGIIAGTIFPGKLTTVFGAATLYAFLPALIFEGAWRLDPATMRRMWGPIATLAVPGVFCTAGIVALCVHYAGGVPWTSALLLGAILSATDPVAVLAIFKRLGLPPALTTIVESEALLNDAVAVVLYRAVLASVVIASQSGALQVSAHAALGTLLGIVCGAVAACAAAALLGRTQQAVAYAALTVAGAYGSFYLAGRFDWSGIFAVLSFAVVLRILQQKKIGSVCSERTGKVWDVIAGIANSALFFLIGAALDVKQLGQALPIALLTVAAVLLARFAIVYGLLEFARPRLHLAWMSVVRLAGIRGALSLALALAIPVDIAGRELIVNVTFVVVVLTLLVGLLTLGRGVKNLPLDTRA
jgi:CPA1 family monovalent cation:H+ antiporter